MWSPSIIDAIIHRWRIGTVVFEEGGHNGAMQPIVPYDRIEIQIDYPLVDDDGETGAAVNAD